MSRASRSLRRAAVILCLVLLLGTAGWVLLIRGLDRLFSSPNLEASLEPLKITIKKAASDFVVVRHGKTAPFLPPTGGYLIAYENDPEGFRADAKVFDTWFNATRLATQVLDRDTDRNWVRSSSEIDYLKPEDRLDAWGHAFVCYGGKIPCWSLAQVRQHRARHSAGIFIWKRENWLNCHMENY